MEFLNLNNKPYKFFSAVILSTIFTILLEIYIVILENTHLFLILNNINTLNLIFHKFSFKHILFFFILFFIIFLILLNKTLRNNITVFIFKYRFFIGGIILIISILFEIHGSSIAELNFLNIDHNTLLGVSRGIRSDEYNVNTLLAFSQYPNSFAYFSEIVRAATTDMFIVYGQPVLDIAIIFRPFQIGYLFLTPAKGLSFFWISRLIVLFLVSFEMGMKITEKNKSLSLAYTFLITFSGAVQWWFAVNGLVEILVFGQLAPILLNEYILNKNYIKRILIGFLLLICFSGFLLVFYPSWQLPFAYIFILLSLWIVFKNYKQFSWNRKDILLISALLLIFSIIMIHVFNNSLNTINIVRNTEYPGNDVLNILGHYYYLFTYPSSIFYPLNQMNLFPNVVENGVFFDFFPIPLILGFIVIFYQKTNDKLLISLIVLYLILVSFFLLDLPLFLKNITLISFIKIQRVLVPLGFLGILILFRAITKLKPIKNKNFIVVFSLISSALIVGISNIYFPKYYLNWMIVIVFIILAITTLTMFIKENKKVQTTFLLLCILISFLTGALVNPIDQGTDVIFESPLNKEVSNIVKNNPEANWIVQQTQLNILLPSGAHTINSINLYPDLDKWHKIDKNKTYEEVYNRYAHIEIELQNSSKSSFRLISPDHFCVNLNINDLKILNVSYITTYTNLENLSNENITFNKINEFNNYKIYRVDYR